MHVTLVYVHVLQDYIEDFIRASEANHNASIQEPGNLRFDILQSADDPTRFVLYEAYLTKKDPAGAAETAEQLLALSRTHAVLGDYFSIGPDDLWQLYEQIGERAGNTSIEEIIMAIKTRQDVFGVEIGADTTQLYETSRLVSRLTGYPVQYNKAIVGRNAFAHEAGIHQDGMLKDQRTYEIMTPESVGLAKSSLVMGKHSGRAAFRSKLAELGYEVDRLWKPLRPKQTTARR